MSVYEHQNNRLLKLLDENATEEAPDIISPKLGEPGYHQTIKA